MDIEMNETCTSWIECGDPLGFMTDFVLSTHLQSNKGRVYGVLRHNKPFLVDQGWHVYISIFYSILTTFLLFQILYLKSFVCE